MKLFTVGPVQMEKDILQASKDGIAYFRNEAFSNKMLSIQNKLLTLFNARDEYKSIMLTCSGTGAMESVIAQITPICKGKKLLIINGGTFGQRFVDICELHNVDFDELNIPIDKDLTKKDFSKFLNTKYFALVCNIHETSIGKLYDKNIILDFCKRQGCLLIVDAISSAFADEYDLQSFPADVTILSSQKALSLAPGLSILLLSKRFIETIKNIRSVSYYLDINSHLKNMERGQTPFTPALHEIQQLYVKLNKISSYSDEVNKVKEKAEYFRNEITKINFKIPKYNLSNCLTPLICPNNNAKEILNALVSVGYYVNPCGGDNANSMLRIGHIGNISKKDTKKLIKLLEEYK